MAYRATDDGDPAGGANRPGPADLAAGVPQTLASEHALLLGQVAARAQELLAGLSCGGWPDAELAALAGYAQAEVLRHASDEEMLLFPAGRSETATRLARDHARLRAGAEVLAGAAAGEELLAPAELAAVTCDFVGRLERHMSAEEEALAAGRAPGNVPATVALGSHPHAWYPLTEGPVIDLDALPAGQAVAAAVDRLLRMRRGERVELRSATDISPVWREMDQLCPGEYGFAVLLDGPDRWQMEVTRRRMAG
jgi:uncharacterized protein (DUF2249 family)